MRTSLSLADVFSHATSNSRKLGLLLAQQPTTLAFFEANIKVEASQTATSESDKENDEIIVDMESGSSNSADMQTIPIPIPTQTPKMHRKLLQRCFRCPALVIDHVIVCSKFEIQIQTKSVWGLIISPHVSYFCLGNV